MNYIAELNTFYDMLPTRRLSPTAIALYNLLMHLANRARWPSTFSVAEATLTSALGVSGSTFRRARAELTAAGIIQHERRRGRQAPVYKFMGLSTKRG